MNIRIFYFIASLFIIPCVSKAQAYIQTGVQEALDAFILHSNNKEWDKAFDLLYPKLFTQVPKQDLIDLMKSLEEDGMSLEMRNTKIISTTPPMKDGDEIFIRVEYTADMTVHITKGSQYGTGKAIQALDGQFRVTYGEENVEWNEDTFDFLIKAKKAMMAISSEGTEWKLVEINMDQPKLMEDLFPEKIMNALVLEN